MLEPRLAELYLIAEELIETREIGGARLARMVEEGPGSEADATIVRFGSAT